MRLALTLIAWLFTLVGFVGIVVPMLPSTPFFLLAVYLFDKGSPRFSDWLRANPISGPTLVAWEKDKVIRPRAKLAASLFVLSSSGYFLFLADRPVAIKVVVGVISTTVLVFLLTRHSRAPERPEPGP